MLAVLLVPPVPPLAEVTFPVVLSFKPASSPTISTLTVQLALAATLPPLKLIDPLPATAVTLPPQLLLAFGGFATFNPAGKPSVNAIPATATVGFGLLIVKVSVVVPPSGIVAAANAFEMVGGATTVSVAVLLVAPVPVSFELITPVVLFKTPAAAPVTVTLNEHDALAASEPPVMLMVLGAVVVTVPPQVVADPFATVSPAGSVSVKLIPVRPSEVFGFVIVNIRLVVPPTTMLEAPNDLAIVGGVATESVAALLAAPVPPLVDVTAPVVLILTPAVVPVTVTLKVQLPPCAIDAPASVIVLFPVIVRVPPH